MNTLSIPLPKSWPKYVRTAEYPNHLWHVDLTTVPTSAGFWVPWFPFTMLQVWPFCRTQEGCLIKDSTVVKWSPFRISFPAGG